MLRLSSCASVYGSGALFVLVYVIDTQIVLLSKVQTVLLYDMSHAEVRHVALLPVPGTGSLVIVCWGLFWNRSQFFDFLCRILSVSVVGIPKSERLKPV